MTGKQRAYLRKLANPLDTIIYIGKEGVTDRVVSEVDDALEARELIKGCVQQGAPVDAKTALTILCETDPVYRTPFCPVPSQPGEPEDHH